MFADMPLDNRTVDQTRLLPPVLAHSGRWKNVTAARNDLKFRRGRSFCNIEPKIRQYG
jgi:hypothetical protein